MIIEVNLLPNVRKKAARTGPSFDVGQMLQNLRVRVRDPWLVAGISGLMLGALATLGMWYYQSSRETALREREQKAALDSARYAAVIAERVQAEEQRDAVRRQIAVISAIDGARLIWPHILEEISRAMPPYIWLRSVTQTSPISNDPPEVQAGVATVPVKKGAKLTPPAAAADSTALALQIVGNTVDIQALTRFMKALEASPFLQNVTLVRSQMLMQQGKEATEFRLDMQYEKPDRSALRMVQFTIPVR